MIELDFGDTPEKLKGEYLDMYKGIQSEVISTTRFDENSDLNTKFAKIYLKMQGIQVGNRQFVSVLFIIPIVIDIPGHRFEIFTFVPEIHENVDLVFGIKNMFELEGIINS